MNPLDFIPKSAMAVAIVILTATSVKLHWDKNGLIVDIAVGKTQIAQLEGAIDKANATAAIQTATLTKKVLDAQNAAKKREVILLADAESAKSALDGLRMSTSQARSTFNLAHVPSYASTELTDTVLKLLDQCSERYTSVAAIADQHASDVKTLVDAWPSVPAPKEQQP